MTELLDQEWQRNIASSVAHYCEMANENVRLCAAEVVWEMKRPSVLYRPKLSLDGDQWCALYGENLQEGVAGFGDTPAAAMAAFDKAWTTPQEPRGEQR